MAPMSAKQASEAFANLPNGYKACLRLAAQGMTSKEIARQTGLRPMTVDTYLKGAKAELGKPNRREAARAFAAWEQSQKLGSQIPDIAINSSPEHESASIGNEGRRRWLRLPPIGGGYHDLNWIQKTHDALRVAVVGGAVLVALIAFIAAVFETFR